MYDKLGALVQRSEEIDETLARPEVASNPHQTSKLAKERADLQSVVSIYQRLLSTRAELADAKTLAGDDDKDLAAMAREEVTQLTAKVAELCLYNLGRCRSLL